MEVIEKIDEDGNTYFTNKENLVDRLAAYEDTGLTPEGVAAMKLAIMGKSVAEITEFDGINIDRLRELAKADKDGRVVVLPCKVGDTVYEVQSIRKRAQPLEIISVQIGRTGGLFFYWELKDGLGIYQNARGFDLSQLDKTVFATREEAEAALNRETS